MFIPITVYHVGHYAFFLTNERRAFWDHVNISLKEFLKLYQYWVATLQLNTSTQSKLKWEQKGKTKLKDFPVILDVVFYLVSMIGSMILVNSKHACI